MGEMPVLSGMLFCADCGAKLYQVRARGRTHEQKQDDLSARMIVLRETEGAGYQKEKADHSHPLELYRCS